MDLDYNCDHVFAIGNYRSPTGKAVFGDTAQRLILSFPGYVTVTMGCRGIRPPAV